MKFLPHTYEKFGTGFCHQVHLASIINGATGDGI